MSTDFENLISPPAFSVRRESRYANLFPHVAENVCGQRVRSAETRLPFDEQSPVYFKAEFHYRNCKVETKHSASIEYKFRMNIPRPVLFQVLAQNETCHAI